MNGSMNGSRRLHSPNMVMMLSDGVWWWLCLHTSSEQLRGTGARSGDFPVPSLWMAGPLNKGRLCTPLHLSRCNVACIPVFHLGHVERQRYGQTLINKNLWTIERRIRKETPDPAICHEICVSVYFLFIYFLFISFYLCIYPSHSVISQVLSISMYDN